MLIQGLLASENLTGFEAIKVCKKLNIMLFLWPASLVDVLGFENLLKTSIFAG
jgi:hypothetical protein